MLILSADEWNIDSDIAINVEFLSLFRNYFLSVQAIVYSGFCNSNVVAERAWMYLLVAKNQWFVLLLP